MDELSRIEAMLEASITNDLSKKNTKTEPPIQEDALKETAALQTEPDTEKTTALREKKKAADNTAKAPAKNPDTEKKVHKAAEPRPEKPKPVKPKPKASAEVPQRKKRRIPGFAIGLMVYILLFAAAAGFGVNTLWKYMDAFEQSRPETFMNSYMSAMTDQDWYDAIWENSSIEVTTFEDKQTVFDQYYESSVTKGDYSYTKKAGRYSDDAPVYAIRSAGNEIAIIGLEKDGEGKAGFGMDLWKVSYIEPSVNSGAITAASVQIDVPAGAAVYLDGITLDSAYIIDDHVDYADLSEIEQRFAQRAHMVRYQVDGIYLNSVISVDGFGEIEPYLVEDGCYYYRAQQTERYSISVLTYSDMTVTLNGAVLTQADAQVSEWELFEEFSEHIPDAPKICHYEITGLYTQPTVSVTDINGTVLEGVTDEDGTVFYNYVYDAQLEAEQKAYIEDFLQKYVNFASGDYNYRYGLHSALTQYVLDGTVLKHYFFKSVSGGGDGGGMLGVEIHELSASNFIRLRDNCYLCTGTLNATERRADRNNEVSAEYLMVVIQSEGKWYIAAMPDQTTMQ